MFPMSNDPTTMLALAHQRQEALRGSGGWGHSRSAGTETRARRLPALLAGVRPTWHLPHVLHQPRHSRVA